MIIVYSASSSLEAHMVKNLLVQHEIPAYVQGEHLQSGAGELPMGGLVKVSVENKHFNEAKAIIKDWESKEETSNQKNDSSPSDAIKSESSHTGFVWSIAGFILGAILMRLYMQSPVTHNGIDLNNDKINDVSWTYSNGIATKTEGDFNFDGKADEITTYQNGLLNTTKADTNFDGVFDTEYQYVNERLSTQKTDTNNDGENDIVAEFGNNALDSTIAIFSLKTNLIKKVQHYKMNKLVSAELDIDDDGKLDVVISYNFAEEEISRKPLTLHP